MSDCPRAGKLFGCKFSPRFDVSGAGYPPYEGAAGGVIAAMEAAKAKTYVRDVCERCGRTIEREGKAS